MKRFAIVIVCASFFLPGCKKDKSDPAPSGPGYTISTGTASNVTNTGAHMTGNLAGVNGKYILSCGHVWSTSHNPTIALPTKTEFGPVAHDTTFTSILTRLKQASAIYVRAYATDSKGTYYGPEVTLVTEAGFFQFVSSSQFLRDDSYIKQKAWVVIYTSQNQLVGVREIVNGQTIVFPPPREKTTDLYRVALFWKYDYVNATYDDSYTMSVFSEQPPNVWYLGTEPDGTNYPQIGTNTVTLSGINLNSYYSWTAQNLYSWGDYEESTSALTFTQYFNPDKIWIEYFDQGQAPFYKWIPDVGLNQNYSLSSTDFTQMSQYVTIQLPYNSDSYIYYESEDDPTTDYQESFAVYWADSDSLTEIKAYYPGTIFPGYYSYIGVRHDNVSEYMVKYKGAIPTQFVSLNASIAVSNESIGNFSAVCTGTADLASATWYHYDFNQDISFTYNLLGSTTGVGTFSAPAIPPELVSLNPELLDLTKLKYNYAFFREMNYATDYQDYINRLYIQPGSGNTDYQYIYYKYIYKNEEDVPVNTDDREVIKRMKRCGMNIFPDQQ